MNYKIYMRSRRGEVKQISWKRFRKHTAERQRALALSIMQRGNVHGVYMWNRRAFWLEQTEDDLGPNVISLPHRRDEEDPQP